MTAGAPQTVRMENKSKVEFDELTPPLQLQRRDSVNAVTGVENRRVPHADDSPLMPR
jgi:hypothetical protein